MTKAEMGLIRDTIKDLQAAVRGRVPIESIIERADENITFIHRRINQTRWTTLIPDPQPQMPDFDATGE